MAVLKNPRHEKYVQNLIKGMSQRKAYQDAFPSSVKWKDETVDSKASVLMNGKVLERYNEIQEEQKEKALLTRWEKRKLLAEIARDAEMSANDRIKAIDTDNKMENEYINKG
ncbi:Phage terminase, small subunit [Lachnospiraceae bacterium TWA4]|nr:Phage terminase, small subunit [Lachnospiraceae bacterium TWA4]